MCGPGDGGGTGGGYSAANYGADIAAGRGGDVGGGWSSSAEGAPSTAGAPVSGAGGLGSPAGTGMGTGLGAGGGWFGEPTTMGNLLGMTTNEQTALSDAIGKAMLSTSPILGTSFISDAIDSARAGGQESGDVIGAMATGEGPGGLGGPGADMITRGGSSYAGPRMPPIPTAAPATAGPSFPGVIAPTIRTGVGYVAERGRTTEEILAANRLRESRERAYAEQRANAESELLKALSLRDTGPESKLQEPGTSSSRFVGLPPTLGQSRHRWA